MFRNFLYSNSNTHSKPENSKAGRNSKEDFDSMLASDKFTRRSEGRDPDFLGRTGQTPQKKNNLNASVSSDNWSPSASSSTSPAGSPAGPGTPNLRDTPKSSAGSSGSYFVPGQGSPIGGKNVRGPGNIGTMNGMGRVQQSPSSSTMMPPPPATPSNDDKRRSFYRSLGTASSPDLSSIRRKQREREGTTGSNTNPTGPSTNSHGNGPATESENDETTPKRSDVGGGNASPGMQKYGYRASPNNHLNPRLDFGSPSSSGGEDQATLRRRRISSGESPAGRLSHQSSLSRQSPGSPSVSSSPSRSPAGPGSIKALPALPPQQASLSRASPHPNGSGSDTGAFLPLPGDTAPFSIDNQTTLSPTSSQFPSHLQPESSSSGKNKLSAAPSLSSFVVVPGEESADADPNSGNPSQHHHHSSSSHIRFQGFRRGGNQGVPASLVPGNPLTPSPSTLSPTESDASTVVAGQRVPFPPPQPSSSSRSTRSSMDSKGRPRSESNSTTSPKRGRKGWGLVAAGLGLDDDANDAADEAAKVSMMRKRMKSTAGDNGSQESSGNGKGLQSTMRKTSGFFKKKFGGGTISSTTPNTSFSRGSNFGTSSAPTTPISRSHSHSMSPSPPPVPAIPGAYVTSLDSTRSDDSPIFTPPTSPPRKGKGTQSSPYTHAPTTSDPPLPIPSSLLPGETKRRSISFSTATGAALANLVNSSGARDPKSSGKSSEDDMKLGLREWEADIDDLLGPIGRYLGGEAKETPHSSAASSALSVVRNPKRPGMPSRAESAPTPQIEVPKSSQSIDNKSEATSRSGLPSILDSGLLSTSPAASPSGTEPTTPVPPLTKPRADSAPAPGEALPSPALTVESADGTPSIRLVPSPYTGADDTPKSPPWVSSDSDANKLPNERRLSGGSGPSTPNREKRLSTAMVGLGLETIRETHSRENSVAGTPSAGRSPSAGSTHPASLTPGGEPHRTPSLPSTSTMGVPVLVTQSPSPNNIYNGPPTHSLHKVPSTPTRRGTRSSIIGYPSTPSTGRSPSGANSFSTSVTSFDSDRSAQKGALEEELKFAAGRPSTPNGTPLEDRAKDLAQKCWDEDESFLKREKIAEWLGGNGRVRKAVLHAYMEKFDFSKLRLDMAFRKLCEQMYLKAESQQIDRILDEFSQRYWDNNRELVYGSSDVVHAISYSLLLLNTDLHVVESSTRMSRSQFVKNTMFAIHSQTRSNSGDGTPDLTFASSNPSVASPDDSSSLLSAEDLTRASSEKGGPPTAYRTRSRRTGSVSSWKGSKDGGPMGSTPNLSPQKSNTASGDGMRSDSMTKAAAAIRNRWWDGEVETILRDMYGAIKSQAIYMPLNPSQLALHDRGAPLTPGSPYGTWGPGNRSAARRSYTTYSGGSAASKRTSLRNFGGFLGPGQDVFRPSSPAPSVATSFSGDGYGDAYNTLGRHSETLAVPTMGFASNLSHTIIREQQEDDATSEGGQSAVDEELALLGAPWAKEGNLQRKHYWEAPGKRSKDKHWLQVFVVINKGELRMFKFGDNGAMSGSSAAMGGGNWLSNAQMVGELSLVHALCSALPPPGYSRDRPHAFVLSLSNGGSYFFQAGTEDLVNEWVSTCNYWAARLSKEPLTGGVSNIDHGWKRVMPTGDDDDQEDMASVRSGHSGKSGKSKKSVSGTFHSHGVANPNDKIFLAEWKPPLAPSVPSNLSEEAQLDNLRRHVQVMQDELQQHQELRAPMQRLYSPRAPNASKALNNWERKSQHLLSEIVKYGTYIDALDQAIKCKNVKLDQKRVEELLKSADDTDPEPDLMGGRGDLDTEEGHGMGRSLGGHESNNEVEEIDEDEAPYLPPEKRNSYGGGNGTGDEGGEKSDLEGTGSDGDTPGPKKTGNRMRLNVNPNVPTSSPNLSTSALPSPNANGNSNPHFQHHEDHSSPGAVSSAAPSRASSINTGAKSVSDVDFMSPISPGFPGAGGMQNGWRSSTSRNSNSKWDKHNSMSGRSASTVDEFFDPMSADSFKTSFDKSA